MSTYGSLSYGSGVYGGPALEATPAGPVAWFDGVVIAIEIALSAKTSPSALWDSALWGFGEWGPDEEWFDLSPRFREFRTRRRFGRDGEAAVWETGTATIVLDNRDGALSPANLAGMFAGGGITQVRPCRPIRIRVSYGDATWHVFRGYVEDFQESYVMAGPNAGDAIVTLPCYDEQGSLALVDGLEQPEQGAGETTGQRIHRILDSAGHTGGRSVDMGAVTLQPTTLSANAVTDLKLVVDSEGGALWVDPDGSVTFENRYALVENERSTTTQAVFGDNDGEINYTDVQPSFSGERIVNIAAFSRIGGVAQQAVDEESRALYKTRRYTRTDLLNEADGDVAGLAQWHVARYAHPEYRVESMSLYPRANPAVMFPEVLSRRMRDLVQVIRRPPGSYVITRDCFVAGVEHRVDWEGNWATTYDLASASTHLEFVTSQWDEGKWDEALWFI